MSTWKAAVMFAVVGLALWLLYPPRQLLPDADRGAVVEIVFMGPGGPVRDEMEDVVREFEKRSAQAHAKDPSRPIYRVVSGQNASRDQTADPTRFLVAVAGQMPPDVIHFDRFAIAEWAARGAFEPLDAYIEADRQAYETQAAAARARGEAPPPPDYPHAQRYYPACWNETLLEGRVYGVPVSVDNRALYYNKDLLVKAGLVYEDGPLKGQARPPRTWEELPEYARRLTEWHDAPANTRMKRLGYAPYLYPNDNSWFYLWAWMNGGEFLSPDGLRCTFTDDANVRALAFMKSLTDEVGGYKKVTSFQAGFQRNELDPFIVGQVAMKIDGSWTLRNIASYGRDLNFGVAPPPLPQARIDAGVKGVSWTGGWALAIPSSARNKAGAWEFIRFLASDDGVRIQARAAKLITEAQGRTFVPNQNPVISLNEEFFQQYAVGNPNLPSRFAPALRTFNDLLPYSRYRPVTPVGQRVWNAHRDAMEDVLYGVKTPEESLAYQQAVVQRELDAFHAPAAGRPIGSWTWFFCLYGVLVVATATLVYLWDTSIPFRRRLGELLPWRTGPHDNVIPGSRGGYFRCQWKEGILCASPWLLGFLVFGGGPMLFSIVMSLCDYDVINAPRFVGLDNYRWMFTRDDLFYLSLWNTAYMVVGIPVGMSLSLGVAMLLNLDIRAMAVWRTFFYLPAIVPLVAASILWAWVFNPQGGFFALLLNPAFEAMGWAIPGWIKDPNWSKPSLIIMGMWSAGSGMIIWLAGLKSIDKSLYEAASVDGAGAWRRFRHITIPQLTPYIFFNLIMGVIGTFQIFAQAFIMTEGGPANTTLFYVYHLFNSAFRYGKMGYASAMAWVLFVIILTLTIINLRLSRRWVHYESE